MRSSCASRRGKAVVGKHRLTLRRILSAKAAVLCAALVAACEAPAPTVSNDMGPESAAPSAMAAEPTAAVGPEARQIVVEDGQSISRIAARYRVPKAAIIAANRLEPPYKIKPGQRLVIPGSNGPAPVPASEARQIVVEEGRSISRIAAKYRVPESAIIEANHLTPPYKIKIGQRLLIPDSNEAEAPVVVASRASEAIPLDDPAPGSAPSSPSSVQPQAEASPAPIAAPAAAEPIPPPVPVAAEPVPPPVPVAAEPVPPPVSVAAEPVSPPAPVAVEPVPPPVPVAVAPVSLPALVAVAPVSLPALVAVAPVSLPVPVAAEPPPPVVPVAVAQVSPIAAAAAPAGATCPPGRTGTWSTDIIKQPVYICR